MDVQLIVIGNPWKEREDYLARCIWTLTHYSLAILCHRHTLHFVFKQKVTVGNLGLGRSSNKGLMLQTKMYKLEGGLREGHGVPGWSMLVPYNLPFLERKKCGNLGGVWRWGPLDPRSFWEWDTVGFRWAGPRKHTAFPKWLRGERTPASHPNDAEHSFMCLMCWLPY